MPLCEVLRFHRNPSMAFLLDSRGQDNRHNRLVFEDYCVTLLPNFPTNQNDCSSKPLGREPNVVHEAIRKEGHPENRAGRAEQKLRGHGEVALEKHVLAVSWAVEILA